MVGGKFAREAHSDSHANGREGRSGRSSTVVRTVVIMVGGKFARDRNAYGCDDGWWDVRQ